MSSPSKQVSVRRLPPLPNQITLKTVRENGSSTEDSHGNLKSRSTAVLSEIHVKEFLVANPQVLEDFIMADVSQEQLERWLIRKTQALQNVVDLTENGVRPSLSKWKFCVHTDKRKLLQQLTKDINQQPKKVRVMFELVKSVAAATHANRHSLYLVDKNERDIYLYSENKPRSRSLCRQNIAQGGTVAAYVAETGERLFIKDILGTVQRNLFCVNQLFKLMELSPDVGLTAEYPTTSIDFNEASNTILGIVELVKTLGHPTFEREDEEIVSSYLAWGSIAIHHAEISRQMQKQKDLNSFLLNVVRSIFDEINTMDAVIEKIMAFAKRLVNADRCSLFMLDSSTNELYANLFDEGDEDGTGYKFINGAEIRFKVDKGIAGHVASTSEILNISDPYRDSRFNREVDMKTGYITKSILCVPVRCKGNIIGVVQMVNSRKGFFSAEDSRSFELFAGYCGLALHYSQMYSQLFRTQQKHQVALEVLSYHCCVPDKELEHFTHLALSSLPEDFYSFEFDVYQSEDDLSNYFIQMTVELFQDLNIRLDLETLARFTQTLRKSYRPVAYHNWAHAFSVAHSMFVIMKMCSDVFTWQEKLSLYLSSICHDIDHRGYNNAFMIRNKTPLGHLYSTSTMEWHHFKQGVFILERDGHNILNALSADQYKEILELMEDAILATDLMLFFDNKAKIDEILSSKLFNWNIADHRKLVRRLLMTACDLCTSAKPWPIHTQSVKKVFEEFYQQGDEEKQIGLTPLPMMDRTRKHELPQNQIAFLQGIVKPCYSALISVLPQIENLMSFIDSNQARWEQRLMEKQNTGGGVSGGLQLPKQEDLRESLSFVDY